MVIEEDEDIKGEIKLYVVLSSRLARSNSEQWGGSKVLEAEKLIRNKLHSCFTRAGPKGVNYWENTKRDHGFAAIKGFEESQTNNTMVDDTVRK